MGWERRRRISRMAWRGAVTLRERRRRRSANSGSAACPARCECGFIGSMQAEAQDGERGPDYNGGEFGEVKPMDVAALKKDGRRNVHEDANDKGHQFARVRGEGRM